ncbi:response regulator [Chamaesiphon sp. VAR_48_metabat_135_sub]|uniref:response regulator n=1 Tax=Chamaesiphon sp. VAR_48_metabat_135_sub TaxID=2964699 RepID=UPI00286D5086|nr:response regulator [Chamaesiphon sp. VAR_48_metabat_135_sub]
MNRLIATADQFSFPARELPQQLLGHIQSSKVGYWEHKFDTHAERLVGQDQLLHWNLGIANGQILYSGDRLWSVQSLMKVVYRYIVYTRNELVRPRFEQLKTKAEEQALSPAQLLAEMKRIGLIDDDRLLKAMKTKILNDLDIYLLMGNGNARFIPDRDLATQLPLAGFSPITLLEEAKQRQLQWGKLQSQVPSMNLIPVLNRQAIEKSNLPDGQQQRIESLVKSQQTLNEIAEEMAKDTLEIAEMFAKLAKNGLVSFQLPKKNTLSPIMAIDDSPMILSQFQHWVKGLGYPVVICQQSETALAQIVEIEPAAIFIDINMPGISGFELVKQIRQQPQLAKIPLVILTGEQKLANRWRAQWTGCDFLTKPLTPGAVGEFQVQLEEMLLKLVGTPTNNYSQN